MAQGSTSPWLMTGMYYEHEDLAPNVDTALNHNYDISNLDSSDIYWPI